MKEDDLTGKVLLDEGQIKNSKGWLRTSWRASVSVGAVTIVAVLICNIGLLVWTAAHYDTPGGIATIHDGDCDAADRIGLWSHLVINILGTVLFSASNNCAQLLCSPTRADVDAAHRRGKWLDIGIPSWRNLVQVPKWRRTLWAALMLSSIPLHLVYNSVIFTTSFQQSYQPSLVTQDFVSGGSWNSSRATEVNTQLDQNLLSTMQRRAKAGQLKNITKHECTREYSGRGFNASSDNRRGSKLGNVLVVSSFESSDGFIDTYDPFGGRNSSCMVSVCPPTGIDTSCRAELLVGEGAFEARCIAQCPSRASINTTCAMYYYNDMAACSNEFVFGPPDSPERKACENRATSNVTACYDTFGCTGHNTTIEYCLAEEVRQRCLAKINIYTLATVIGFNAIKAFALLVTLYTVFDPLATIGDAIASFMDRPAMNLHDLGPVSIFDVLQSKQFERPLSKAFSTKGVNWGDAVNIENGNRWQWGTISSLLCLVASGLMFCISVVRAADTVTFSMTVNLDNLIDFTRNAPLALTTSLPNIPQLIISFVYVFYNNTITSMLQDYEYSRFATHRRPLRVSSRTGQQRSTYWLQIPYRYILPLMSAMATLHFLVARAIYFVQQNVYDAYGQWVPDEFVSGCGYSTLSHMLALALGIVLIGGLYAISFRKLAPGIPLASSCSLVIAIACANALEEGGALKPVQYGVLVDRPPDEQGRRYVGFSSGEVEPLEDGVEYR